MAIFIVSLIQGDPAHSTVNWRQREYNFYMVEELIKFSVGSMKISAVSLGGFSGRTFQRLWYA